MRILAQRVKNARVTVDGKEVSGIEEGLLLLVGVGIEDVQGDIERLVKKVVNLRVFDDEKGKMNLNIRQIAGSILSVPQFTLYADTSKGHRPGFDSAADPVAAKDCWMRFNDLIRNSGIDIKEGVFGAHMEVSLTNDGPVTIWLDSRCQ